MVGVAVLQIAMAVLMVVEFIAIIDIYHENVAGKRFANVDLSGKVYIVTGSNTGLGGHFVYFPPPLFSIIYSIICV